MKPIILTGFMGCGKSTIGRLLAEKLNCHFEDADAVIEKRAGMTISQIFELEGEEGFRKREKEVLADLLNNSSLVLATGGGAVLLKENRELFLQKGIVIFLKTDPKRVYKRLSENGLRPLAKGKTLGEMTALYESRMPYYEECHICYDTLEKSPLQCVNELQKILREVQYGN